MIIVPNNMNLRPIADDDHQFLIELHNDPDVLRNLTHAEPITFDQHMAWWKRTKLDSRQLRLIFTIDDECVGLTKFYDIDHVNRNCVLGADIHKAYRGKGYAKHMWNLMLSECFTTMKLHRVSLTTAEFNKIAQRVYRNLGFKEEGRLIESLFRFNAYHDQICMYMLQNDWLRSSYNELTNG